MQKSRGKYANVIIPTVSNDSGAGERTVDSIGPRTVSWESFISFFFPIQNPRCFCCSNFSTIKATPAYMEVDCLLA